MAGSTKWRTSKWEDMLRAVLPVLIEHRSSVDWWSFGGGAALAHHLHHRISYDIDLFVDSAKDLKALVPNANPLMKKLAGANKYEYLGNHLKVPYGSPPIGEINITIAASVSDHPFELFSFKGQDIRIETIDEILAKKCLFRASRFTNRDMFDLAASLDKDPTVLSRLQPAIQEALPLLEDRIRRMAPTYTEVIANDVNPTPIGRKFMSRDAMDSVLKAVSDLSKGSAARSSVNEPR